MHGERRKEKPSLDGLLAAALQMQKIFTNYALKSMSDVNAKLDEAALYIERNRMLVKSIVSFPYIAKSY